MSKSKYHPDEKTSIDPAFFERSRPPFKLSTFMYNKKDGTYFGRTTESWGKNKYAERVNEKVMKMTDLNCSISAADCLE